MKAFGTIDRLMEASEVELVALFSPEHGIRGTERGGDQIESGSDPKTGLPIHSLYGATRKPTPKMLDGLEVLLGSLHASLPLKGTDFGQAPRRQ